jgi:hypothetical protein
VEKLGHIGHHGPLIRRVHVAKIFDLEQALHCQLQAGHRVVMTNRYAEILLRDRKRLFSVGPLVLEIQLVVIEQFRTMPVDQSAPDIRVVLRQDISWTSQQERGITHKARPSEKLFLKSCTCTPS